MYVRYLISQAKLQASLAIDSHVQPLLSVVSQSKLKTKYRTVKRLQNGHQVRPTDKQLTMPWH